MVIFIDVIARREMAAFRHLDLIDLLANLTASGKTYLLKPALATFSFWLLGGSRNKL